MIRVENLSYKIGNKQNEKLILNNINLTIPKNKLTAIIGANGAGKSTLLHLMARLIPLQSGNVYYGDINLVQKNDEQLAKVLAILSQQSTINSRILVSELLMFGRYPYHKGKPTEQDKKIVSQMLNQFHLTDFQNRYLDTLSGGQKQRVFIAIAFCQTTPYILLDEPLNNLDLYHSNQLMNLINDSIKEQTAVIVLHDINQALAFADYIVAMKAGRVVYQGTPQEIITAENIKNLFNVDVEIIEHNGKVRMFY